MNKMIFKQEGAKLTVTRHFSATLDKVWRAWTEADLLDQWWAPKPWVSKTKSMNFTEGGTRLYAMCGPEGEEHYGLTTYNSIVENEHFAGEDSFCDSEGIVNPDFPTSTFDNTFEAIGFITEVTIISEYASAEHLQQVIEMGMKQGLSMAFDNLDEVLSSLN